MSRVPPGLHSDYEKEDEDVSAERARITQNTTSGNSVTVSELSKVRSYNFNFCFPKMSIILALPRFSHDKQLYNMIEFHEPAHWHS
jgi:hypothetical protein